MDFCGLIKNYLQLRCVARSRIYIILFLLYKLLCLTIRIIYFNQIFQLFGCSLKYLAVFDRLLNNVQMCIIEQLFSIVCVNLIAKRNIDAFHSLSQFTASAAEKVTCNLGGMDRETKIGFDVIAFAFIILQLRILNSWFFQRCIIEFRCELIQAKRCVESSEEFSFVESIIWEKLSYVYENKARRGINMNYYSVC